MPQLISTRKELADVYAMHPDTLSKYLKEIGIKARKRLLPKDIRRIYAEMGEPEKG